MLSSFFDKIVDTCVHNPQVASSLSVMTEKYNPSIGEFFEKPAVGVENPSFAQWFTGAGKPEILAVAEFDGYFDSEVFRYSSKHPHDDTLPVVLSENPNGSGYVTTTCGVTGALPQQTVVYSSKFFAVTVSDMTEPSNDSSFSFVLRFFAVNIGHDSLRSKEVIGEDAWFALGDLKSALSRGVPRVQGVTFPLDEFVTAYDSQDASLSGFVSWLKSKNRYDAYSVVTDPKVSINSINKHKVNIKSANSKRCEVEVIDSSTTEVIDFDKCVPIMFAGGFLVLMFKPNRFIIFSEER